jgi:hypothetical protein
LKTYAAKGSAMIIFLDFDGVLHPEPCDRSEILCHLPKLERVLREFPDVEVVVTSTWRHTRSIVQFRSLFSSDVAHRVVGLTPRWHEIEDNVYRYHRQAEVEAWLKVNRAPWDKFIVLDDRAWLFSPFYPHLLKCDPLVGIDDLLEQTLRCRLTELG